MSIIMDVVKIYGKGRVQIPSKIRKELQLADGDEAYWIKDPYGKYYIEKVPQLKKDGARYVRERL